MTEWSPNPRYPDPAIEIVDPSFLKYRLFNASVERLASGTRWGEGPVWFGDGRYLLWSDIPNDRILRWDEATGNVSVYRQPSNKANGNTRDRQGRLITCEHFGRRVTRTEYDGSITVLMDQWQGKRLNSPNDVVVKSDGSVWFTDPPFGLSSHYEGQVNAPDLPARVYRIDPSERRSLDRHGRGVGAEWPLLLSGRKLALRRFLARRSPPGHSRVRRCRRQARRQQSPVRRRRARRLAGRHALRYRRQSLVRLGHGRAGARRREVFNPTGALIGRIALPERCANVAFGGANRNRLFMACGHGLYALYVNTQGAKGG